MDLRLLLKVRVSVTIRKGKPWGETTTLPAGVPVAHSDVEAGRLVADGVRELALAAGDLARTMGGGAPGRMQGSVVRVPIDLVHVQLDERRIDAVAHVVARAPGPLGWSRGPLLFAMNAQYLGPYDLAPRGHPNDGRLDVLWVDPSMPPRARLAARRRARTGTHVPHPQLMARQVTDERFTFDRPLAVWVDGHRWHQGSVLHLAVEPDALTVYA